MGIFKKDESVFSRGARLLSDRLADSQRFAESVRRQYFRANEISEEYDMQRVVAVVDAALLRASREQQAISAQVFRELERDIETERRTAIESVDRDVEAVFTKIQQLAELDEKSAAFARACRQPIPPRIVPSEVEQFRLAWRYRVANLIRPSRPVAQQAVVQEREFVLQKE